MRRPCIFRVILKIDRFKIILDLLNPPKEATTSEPKEAKKDPASQLTKEEEAELAELMDED